MTSPTNNPNECPVDQVEQLAKGPQDQPIPQELCQHLEQCADCRARLEAAAAPELDWARVRRVLKIQPLPEQDNAAKVGLNFSLLRLLSPSDDPGIVGKIGPFEITEVIGSGGMGLVLKGRDPALDRFVAVKILAPHLASSATARRRFGREARAAAAVIHDNVIAIYQVSEHHELPYLVMPYLPDPSLQQRLDLQGKLDLESALSISLQVANGLQAAHSQGLIHRDIKPANVLLAKGTERAIITDFGLARAADDASLTSSGILAGTPHYMSPEQARGEAVDARSDLFSLGSLIYAMVAGTPPVNRELASETIRVIAAEPMPRLKTVAPDIPDWVDRLVAWLHQTNPENRPQSAQEIAEVLEQCLIHLRQPESHPLPERLTTAEEPAMANPKDNRLFSLIALFLFLGTLLSPALIAMTTRDEYALVFGAICGVLALAFAFLSWSEPISRGVAKTLGGLILAACIGLAVLTGIFEFRSGDKLRRLQEESRAAMAAALEKQQTRVGKNKNEVGMGEDSKKNEESSPSELKLELGEDEPIPEWKKPKVVPIPQLTGTWVATKAYLNGEEFKSKEEDQKIWLVSYGDSIFLQLSRGFRNAPQLHLGAGTIRLVPGRDSRLFMVSLENLETKKRVLTQKPIFSTFDLKGEILSIAFSEIEPALSPEKGRDYYEFKRFSHRYPKHLDPMVSIKGNTFFCSSEEANSVAFPALKGGWICENFKLGRKSSQIYAKLDPKGLVLQGSGKSLVISHYPNSNESSGSSIPTFPRTTWTFSSWGPGGKGPIQCGKRLIEKFGVTSDFIAFETKGKSLLLTVADSVDDLKNDGENDKFEFRKITDEPIIENLASYFQKNNQNGPPRYPDGSSGMPKSSSVPSSSTTPPTDLGSGNPADPTESETGKPKTVPASAPLSQAEQLKKLLGEGEPEFAWNKPQDMPFPELYGTWKATKSSLNGKDYRPADSQNNIWLVVNSYGLKLMENTLPEPNQNSLELGQGPIIAHPFPTVGDNAHRFAIPIGTFRRSGQEKAFATINGLFSITPDKGGDKLRIAFSEGDPEQKTGAGRDYFELERVSPLVPKAIRDGRPFAAKPFACSTGKVAPITVPALAGTWEVTKANLQKTDFLGKHPEAKLKVLSDGIFLTLLLEEPRPRRRILGHGKLESWQPNSQGFFRIDCGIQNPAPQPPLWLKGRFEKSSSGDLKLTLSNEEKGVPMPNNLLAHLVREDYLEGKKVTDDPLLSLKRTPSLGWGNQNRELAMSPPSYGYFRHYLFPCASPIQLADSANWNQFDFAPDPESGNVRLDPWVISEKEGAQKLTVQLAEPVKGASQVSFVSLEPFGPGVNTKGAYNSDPLKDGDKIAIFHNVPAGPYQVILKLTLIPSKALKLGEIEVLPGKEIAVQPKKTIGLDH